MKKRIFHAALYMVGTIILGTVGFIFLEGMTFFQAVYLTIATITTVGYGDAVPHTLTGKILTMVLMVAGVGVALYFASTVVASVIEGEMAEAFGRRKMERKIRTLREHIIICGAGRVGQQVIERLKKEDVQFVVVEKDLEIIHRLRSEGVLAVNGDATEDSLLMDLGIQHARGLITALPDDAQNIFVTLTSKGLNPKAQVVARMDRIESESKFRRAGADKVISPAILGGRRMAITMLKPGTCEYVDTLFYDKHFEMEIEEILVGPGSGLIGETLHSSAIREATGIIVLAIVRDGSVISNPGPAERMQEGDVLIALGSREQMGKLEELALGYCKLDDKTGQG